MSNTLMQLEAACNRLIVENEALNKRIKDLETKLKECESAMAQIMNYEPKIP